MTPLVIKPLTPSPKCIALFTSPQKAPKPSGLSISSIKTIEGLSFSDTYL